MTVDVAVSPACAYIFLDESGNLDFSQKGTRHFVLTAVSTKRPFPACHALDAYKHDCLEDFKHRLDKEYFHCAEDNRHVRGRVFELIATGLDDMRIDSIIVEKSKTGPALRQGKRFYPRMLGYLLKWILPRELTMGAEKVLVITDKLPIREKRHAVEKACKLALANSLPRTVKHQILHHESRSHYLLQVADYCCWASGVPRAQITTGDHVSLIRAARSALSALEPHLLRSYRNRRKIPINSRESRRGEI